jgi:hypothetical protein
VAHLAHSAVALWSQWLSATGHCFLRNSFPLFVCGSREQRERHEQTINRTKNKQQREQQRHDSEAQEAAPRGCKELQGASRLSHAPHHSISRAIGTTCTRNPVSYWSSLAGAACMAHREDALAYLACTRTHHPLATAVTPPLQERFNVNAYKHSFSHSGVPIANESLFKRHMAHACWHRRLELVSCNISTTALDSFVWARC